MGSKKVIIHAGLHKTGTSSIQLACKMVSDSLLDHGILYPSFGGSQWANHSVPLSLLFMDHSGKNNHTVNAMFGSEYARIDAAEKIRQNLVEELSKNKIQTILISGEDLSIFTSSNLESLKDFFIAHGFNTFEIILYVRNPISFSLSNAQELVRAGLYSIGEAIKFGNLQKIKVKVTRFVDVFGEHSVSVFSYDDCVASGIDVVNDFENKLGLSGLFYNLEMPRANSSMSLEKVLVLSAIKYHGLSVLEFIKLLPDAGSQIIPENSLVKLFWMDSEIDRFFIMEKFGINYIEPVTIFKPSIDFDILKSHLKIVQSIDSTLDSKLMMKNIFEDIKDIMPELAVLIQDFSLC